MPYIDDVDPSIPLLSLPEVAAELTVPVTRVHQLLREHKFIAMRRHSVIGIPEAFFSQGTILKDVPGLLIVLRDGGYGDEEIMRWLFTEDESLPGTPMAALHGPLAREVLRRAQAKAF